MAIESILPALKGMPVTQMGQTSSLVGLLELVHNNFSLSTWIMVGACLQVCASAATGNSFYAMLPATTLLTIRILDALMIYFNIRPNPYMEKVFLKRSTAVVPDAKGELAAPGSERIAVLLLGAKTNHPFGVLDPEFLKFSSWLTKMTEQFDKESERPHGFLGQTNWHRKDERGASELTFISYWRNIEDLHAFAHSPLHREAWRWWEKTIKQHNAIGINHEVFEADPGHWENVYINFQPTGLGATTYLRTKDGNMTGGEVGDNWISPLVDATHGKLRSSAGRLGRSATKFDADRPDASVY